MNYYFAPLEGVTGSEFRRAHHRWFPGVDAYYMPFLSPTQDHVFTPRELRNVLPEHNQGFRAVPQLLTKNPEDFLWCAGELAAMGYGEVNLNLGCPSGTVTAKGKGAGMLARPEELDCFLDTVFSQAPPMKISLKTRLGLEDPEEFPRLLEIFAKYPVSLLTVLTNEGLMELNTGNTRLRILFLLYSVPAFVLSSRYPIPRERTKPSICLRVNPSRGLMRTASVFV